MGKSTFIHHAQPAPANQGQTPPETSLVTRENSNTVADSLMNNHTSPQASTIQDQMQVMESEASASETSNSKL